jgi:hypothetical protein
VAALAPFGLSVPPDAINIFNPEVLSILTELQAKQNQVADKALGSAALSEFARSLRGLELMRKRRADAMPSTSQSQLDAVITLLWDTAGVAATAAVPKLPTTSTLPASGHSASWALVDRFIAAIMEEEGFDTGNPQFIAFASQLGGLATQSLSAAAMTAVSGTSSSTTVSSSPLGNESASLPALMKLLEAAEPASAASIATALGDLIAPLAQAACARGSSEAAIASRRAARAVLSEVLIIELNLQSQHFTPASVLERALPPSAIHDIATSGDANTALVVLPALAALVEIDVPWDTNNEDLLSFFGKIATLCCVPVMTPSAIRSGRKLDGMTAEDADEAEACLRGMRCRGLLQTDRLQEVVSQAAQSLQASGADPFVSATSPAFARHAASVAEWTRVLEALHITPDECSSDRSLREAIGLVFVQLWLFDPDAVDAAASGEHLLANTLLTLLSLQDISRIRDALYGGVSDLYAQLRKLVAPGLTVDGNPAAASTLIVAAARIARLIRSIRRLNGVGSRSSSLSWVELCTKLGILGPSTRTDEFWKDVSAHVNVLTANYYFRLSIAVPSVRQRRRSPNQPACLRRTLAARRRGCRWRRGRRGCHRYPTCQRCSIRRLGRHR